LLRQLQENAHKLKKLPQHKVEPSLVEAVMQAIAETKSQPKPTYASSRRRRPYLPYLAATLAASLLIAVVGFLGWKALNEADKKKEDGPAFVHKEKEPDPKPEPTPIPKKTNPLLAKMTETIVRDFGAPLPIEKPFSAAFAELKKDGKGTGQLVHELNREKSVQLDVTVKNGVDAMKRLRDVLKDEKIAVVTDPTVKKNLDDKKPAKVEYYVYAENLTTGELSKLMNELSDTYVVGVGNNEKKMQSPYQRVTLTPLAKEEKQKVAKLLGVDAATMDRKEAKPETKTERVVVLLPIGANGQPSAELRQFVNQRRAPQPGAVQVLIKIRQE